MRPAPLVAALATAAAGALAAGCPRHGDEGECDVDPQCGGDHVCARDHTCLPPSAVRAVRTTWTIRGAPASMAACASTPDLAIQFEGNARGEELRFAPVPCHIGQYTIDKLPFSYTRVRLGVEAGTVERIGLISTDGQVAIDLPL